MTIMIQPEGDHKFGEVPRAYRSDAIPVLPPGGHPDIDKAFQRLPWGHYQNPLVPNTMTVQLAYAGLFEDESDAEDGRPWGESEFSISKGFLSGLQSFLYILYMCCALMFFVSFLPLAVGVVGTIMYRPNIEGLIFLFDAYKYIYLIIAIGYFGGKYGRLLLAHLSDKHQRANPTGLYRREGMVRIKESKSVFEAPFIEFDAYLIHSPSGRGGRYFNLLLQHRYSKHKLFMKGLVTDAMNQKDIYAYWDMIPMCRFSNLSAQEIRLPGNGMSATIVTRSNGAEYHRNPGASTTNKPTGSDCTTPTFITPVFSTPTCRAGVCQCRNNRAGLCWHKELLGSDPVHSTITL